MYGQLNIKEALDMEDPIFIDLRAPLEYSKGTIPGAVNIPLFDDREREIIGTVYKQDKQEARAMGVAFASPKLPRLFAAIEEHSRAGTPVLFCWRGGQRSKVLYELLKSLDVEVYRLQGGYKSYRRFILDRLDIEKVEKPVYVLNGLTGVGKTEVLQILGQMGCPVIDLEGLAGHRGSLFGHLGIAEQRSQKDFDALLLKHLDALEHSTYMVVEGEGKRIGPVTLPNFLFEAMQRGKHILLTAPLKLRVQRILGTYSPQDEAGFQAVKSAILSLKKYMGKKNVQQYIQLLEDGKTQELVSQLCNDYYDRFYDDSDPEKRPFQLIVDSSNPRQAAKEILHFIELQSHQDEKAKATYLKSNA